MWNSRGTRSPPVLLRAPSGHRALAWACASERWAALRSTLACPDEGASKAPKRLIDLLRLLAAWAAAGRRQARDGDAMARGWRR